MGILIPTSRVVEFKRAAREMQVKIIRCSDFEEGTYFLKIDVGNPYDLVLIGVQMGINQCYDSIGYREAKAVVAELMSKTQDFIDNNK